MKLGDLNGKLNKLSSVLEMQKTDITGNIIRANNGVQGTRHKVSGPLTPDVLLRNTMINEWCYRDDNR